MHYYSLWFHPSNIILIYFLFDFNSLTWNGTERSHTDMAYFYSLELNEYHMLCVYTIHYACVLKFLFLLTCVFAMGQSAANATDNAKLHKLCYSIALKKKKKKKRITNNYR